MAEHTSETRGIEIALVGYSMVVSKEFMENIESTAKSFKGILGIHDLKAKCIRAERCLRSLVVTE